MARPASGGGLDFRGTDRFEIRRRIGAGGFGVVYEAFDRERAAKVALKTLSRTGLTTLFRFKQEFRRLADFAHPNLVALHELVKAGDEWFFTMELIEGAGFLEHVRPGTDLAFARTLADSSVSSEPESDPAAVFVPALGSAPTGTLDVHRLRAALPQLAAGVHALHAGGTLHRDIKPSNVMVTREGRVVLLDFGLATDLEGIGEGLGLGQSVERSIVGTAAYMAPEQAAALPLTEASDWYGVGAVVYEALTGRVPFEGAYLDVLIEKRKREPPAPRDVAGPACPADLSALCVDLLRLRPEERPRGADVLRRLGVREEAAFAAIPGFAGGLGVGAPLVGRARHLAALAAAYAGARRGRAVLVHLHGGAGLGKSAILRRFLEGLRLSGEALVLKGRCFERESVPYKAIDGLVDALARHLHGLATGTVRALAPRDAGALVRLFPILAGVADLAPAAGRKAGTPDPLEQRRRGFAAFRELLQRLAATRPLVLAIDDLQWGDGDSAALLAELLRPPDPPPLLLVTAYESEAATAAVDSPCVRVLPRPVPASRAPREEPAGGGVDVREVALLPLAVVEARDLALALFARGVPGEGPAGAVTGEATGDWSGRGPGAGGQLPDDQADAIARESGGNPLFVAELVEHVREGSMRAAKGSDSGRPLVTLDDVLKARFLRLEAGARRLLEVAALAAGPVEQAVACRAAAVEPAKERATVTALRAASFLRTRFGHGRDEVEVFHGRVREAAAAAIPEAERRVRHRALAEALVASGRADPEALATHFLGAGDLARAAVNAALAADRAAEALAFDRAARLYRQALTLGAGHSHDEAAVLAAGPPRADLLVRLGDALVGAGRGAEAAEAYLQAASEGGGRPLAPAASSAGTGAGASGAPVASVAPAALLEPLELRRRAAEQLLRSGHIDKGLETVRAVLADVGMALARTPRRALLSLLLRRAWIRIRGLGFTERDAAAIPAKTITRIDVCWSVAMGLSVVDNVRGADFQTRHLVLALGAGEPYRVIRALAVEAGYSACTGVRNRRRTASILETAMALSRRLDHPHAIGLTTIVAGTAAFLEGRFRTALELSEQGEAILRDRCTGVAWEIVNAQLFAVLALYYLGEVKDLAARVESAAGEAEERGDLYAAANVRVALASVGRLSADDPDAARGELDEIMARWSRAGYQTQHYQALLAHAKIDLYVGDGEGALARVAREWRDLERALLLRIQYVRVVMLHLRARCALAAAARRRGSEAQALLGRAARDAGRIERERAPWAAALAALIRAGAAHVAGDAEAAASLLAGAELDLAAADLKLYAAAARRSRGQVAGGAAGRALVASADAFFANQGVRDPARMTRMLAPGLDGPG